MQRVELTYTCLTYNMRKHVMNPEMLIHRRCQWQFKKDL